MISQVTIDIDYVAKEIEQTLVYGPERRTPRVLADCHPATTFQQNQVIHNAKP